MKLFWHIGPHKTGTTSLQLALAAHAHSGNASYYYPPPAQHGPGHAHLAWQLLGLNGVAQSTDPLLEQIRQAESHGYAKIVLSSEEFSRALEKPDGFEPIARVCEDVEAEIVITLRPLVDRLYPEIQERIKHGRALQLEAPMELLAACLARPGLRPDFVSAAVLKTRASAVSVILVDADDPAKLFASFSTIIGDDVAAVGQPRANASYSFVKTAWLNALNAFTDLVPAEARKAAEVAFTAAARQSSSLADSGYPPLPEVIDGYLRAVWQLQLDFLKELERAGRVRII